MIKATNGNTTSTPVNPRLPTERIRSGLLNLRLHCFVQIWTFLIYPFLGIAIVWLYGNILHPAVAIIAYIVYCAFCASFAGQVWIEVGWSPVIQVILLCIVLLCIVLPLVALSVLNLVPHKQPQIAAFFCASQKGLATGIPMASVVFAATSPDSLGLILLPILIFHPLQLLIGAALIPHMSSITRNIRHSPTDHRPPPA